MVGTVTRNLKRKRAASTATRKSSSRGLTKAIRSSTTPVLHASKKIRAMPSTRRKTDETPTRLFALWKADGLYYPGTAVSHDKDKPARYVVRFDDGDQAQVEISHMRLCDLRVGDQVLLAPYNVNGTVVDVRRAEAESMITVDVGDAAGACRIETNIKNLRIASRTIFRAWNERILTASNVKVGPSTKTPKNAPPGSGESYEEPSQPLAKIGLVMTTSPGNKGSKIGGGTAGQKGNEIWSKAKVVKTIRNLGGTVIENWPDLFSMNGEHDVDNKRWVIKRSDVRCLQHNQLDHVFLLSDDASATPKFLIALALGIPCLHFDWLKHGGDLGWSRFLLPAGICSYPAGEGKMYHALVSQTVDLCWGDSPDYMEHIMYNPVASKLLEDKSVLCIGDHFVPLPVEKENDDNEFHRMVPRIILSMGASRVESVHDVGFASQRLTEFHYVVVNDHRDVQGLPKEIKCVDWGWMKNCLIAGRLLPYPDYWKEN
ncbi:uncharacterized protein LAESUDRAFT_646420 [Laetiporus sulphureus 93-53]|uniref:BRCT domain-containing protein n=1 Tax=Laetiporus sulphureus 93-53 TaxID=1314785 RepID=A0A165FX40_9APHY|nr:uncharacterized protein LAESUDRAFT_646420 [Laetiporus sulphureus 93-53]KZT09527.1 hypothetical protein LAESUDRAFT_646420 [Laetiporus sulphureus 93-53]